MDAAATGAALCSQASPDVKPNLSAGFCRRRGAPEGNYRQPPPHPLLPHPSTPYPPSPASSPIPLPLQAMLSEQETAWA